MSIRRRDTFEVSARPNGEVRERDGGDGVTVEVGVGVGVRGSREWTWSSLED